VKMNNKRQQEFLDRLQNGPVIIGDGGMGTQLYHRGAPVDAVFEYLNLIDADLVSQVHRDYLEAGAETIETNTFGANRLRLSGFGLEEKTRQINLAGARLARAAAGETRWVAGSIGPVVKPRGSTTELRESELETLFSEQMTALAEGGVDYFLLETFGCLFDLQVALQVADQIGLPAIAQLAFNEGGFSGDGLTVELVAERLAETPPAAIGANCGAGPRELLQVLKRLAAVTSLPITAFPNSGFPEYVNGRHLYLATPDYFAALGQEMVTAGINLVGGCCGTGPEHILALTQKLAGQRPGTRPSRALQAISIVPPEKPCKRPHHFLTDWGNRPIITVELDPPKGLDIATTLERARVLSDAGVDAINLAENPLARIRMGNLALACRIQEETATEVIVHVTGRDRNLIGLHSDLMGAHLLGIRTVLAVTGDPVAVSGETGASSVFDVNSIGLLKLLDALNQGQTTYGADLKGRTSFLLGAAFNPNVADLGGQLRKLEKKIAAGAQFVQTQPVYDLSTLARLMEETAALQIPVLMGIMPLVSERNAEFLHNEVPGISLPERVRARMRGKSGSEGVAEGMAIAQELVASGMKAGLGGYYLIPPFGKVELAVALIKRIRRGEE
jgi:methionine synthase I (cobalamin-dependent)/5,10-methylenetetrahydrofolate reductase